MNNAYEMYFMIKKINLSYHITVKSNIITIPINQIFNNKH